MLTKKWLIGVAASFLLMLTIPTHTANASIWDDLKTLFGFHSVQTFTQGPKIPGVEKHNWVPQGLTYLPTKNWLLLSAYWYKEQGNNQASTISAVSRDSGKLLKNVYLYENKTGKHFGHVGGISVSNHYLWVASTKGKHNYLLKYALQDLIQAKDNEKLVPKKVYDLAHGTSYVTYHQSSQNHKQLCIGKWIPQSKAAQGYLYCHTLDQKENLSLTKVKTYQTPPDVQGIEIYGNNIEKATIIYSRAYGRKYDSTLDIYQGLENEAKLIKQHKTYSMSQELVRIGNQLYINFESGTKKYRPGGKQPIYHLYSIKIPALLK